MITKIQEKTMIDVDKELMDSLLNSKKLFKNLYSHDGEGRKVLNLLNKVIDFHNYISQDSPHND